MRTGRRLRALTVIVVSLTMTACANWSQLGGSASRQGYQPFELSIGPANVSSLTERWSANIGGNHGEEGTPSSPVIANGVAYEGYAGELQAYDATGSRG